MPILFQYLLKLSVSLGIMYLFYQFVLRRLTFYNHNRWYLTGYSLLCFFISFINISPILEKNKVVSHEIVTFIPTIETLTIKVSPDPAIADALGHWTIWSWLFLFLIAGTGILLLRLAFQLISFKRLTGKAKLIADVEIKFYQVNENIIPFSFGNSIFINQHLHTEAELKEIIRHEFIHVKQRHTVDIIWSEILCILNWYNPFAWLIRKAIRQNLEFIADHKVVENGMDKKQYQYLLLKVIGNNHFSIASNFNFSSLKKRIAMMNKIRSAKLHLIKFLFVLPLMAIAILAFRKEEQSLKYAVIVYDAETLKPVSNVRIKGIYNNADYITNSEGYIEIPASVDSENKMHISYDFIKEGYIKWWGRKFETNFKKGKPNSIIELIGIKRGTDNGFCDICGAASQDYGHSGLKSSLEKEAWKFFNLLIRAKKNQGTIANAISNIASIDTTPKQVIANDKGYYIGIKDNKGNCTVVVEDKNRKEVKRLLLTEWNKNEKYYEGLFGEIPEVIKSNSESSDENKSIVFTGSIKGTIGENNRKPSFKNMIVTADTLIWLSDKTLHFKGRAMMENKDDTITINADVIKFSKLIPLVYIDGKEAELDKNYIGEKGGSYKIVTLDKAEGLKKYGEKGKNGVVEIISLAASETNFIEKRKSPAWDIKNFLPGKKKDEC